MSDLTPRQTQILRLIQRFISDTGMPPTRAEIARELCYRLYTLCERKKRAVEAFSYNALVQSWPEIMRLARETRPASPTQSELFR